MKILIIDNYDSFTFNLVHYVEQFVDEVVVIRNDQPFEDELSRADKLILSPGPGLPHESGRLLEIVDKSINTLPILGVCLGQQALGVHFGGSLVNMKTVHHGEASRLNILKPKDPLFRNINQGTHIGHYHSWVIDRENFPDCLEITSTSLGTEIMSIKHKNLPVWGVQFHPESILTDQGLQMIENWVNLCN